MFEKNLTIKCSKMCHELICKDIISDLNESIPIQFILDDGDRTIWCNLRNHQLVLN